MSSPRPYLCALRSVITLYELEERSTTIGRDANNDLVLDSSKGISRFHAKLDCLQPPSAFRGGRGDEGRFQLVDLGSANGTFVNGERLASHEGHLLKHGDLIFFSAYSRFGAPELGNLDANVNMPPGRERMIGGDSAGLRSLSRSGGVRATTYPAHSGDDASRYDCSFYEDAATSSATPRNRSHSAMRRRTTAPDPAFQYRTKAGSIKCRPLAEVLPSRQGDPSESPSRKRFRELNEKAEREEFEAFKAAHGDIEIPPTDQPLPGQKPPETRHSRIGMNPEVKNQLRELESRLDALQEMKQQAAREPPPVPDSVWASLPFSAANLQQACSVLEGLLATAMGKDRNIAEVLSPQKLNSARAPELQALISAAEQENGEIVFPDQLPRKLLRLAEKLEAAVTPDEDCGRAKRKKRRKRGPANRTGGFIVGNPAPDQMPESFWCGAATSERGREGSALSKEEREFLQRTVRRQEDELTELREQLGHYLKYFPDGFNSLLRSNEQSGVGNFANWRDRLALNPKLTVEESAQLLVKITDAERLCGEYQRRRETVRRRYLNLQEQVRNMRDQARQYVDQVTRLRQQNGGKCPEMLRIRQERHLQRRRGLSNSITSGKSGGAGAVVASSDEVGQLKQNRDTLEFQSVADKLEAEAQSLLMRLFDAEVSKSVLTDELESHVTRRETYQTVIEANAEQTCENLAKISSAERVLMLEKLCESLEWELLRETKPDVHNLVVRSSLPSQLPNLHVDAGWTAGQDQSSKEEQQDTVWSMRALLDDILARNAALEEKLLETVLDGASKAPQLHGEEQPDEKRRSSPGPNKSNKTRSRSGSPRKLKNEDGNDFEVLQGDMTSRGRNCRRHVGVTLYEGALKRMSPANSRVRDAADASNGGARALRFDGDRWKEARGGDAGTDYFASGGLADKRSLSQAARYRSLSNPRVRENPHILDDLGSSCSNEEDAIASSAPSWSQMLAAPPEDGRGDGRSSKSINVRSGPGRGGTGRDGSSRRGRSPRSNEKVESASAGGRKRDHKKDEFTELEAGFKDEWRPSGGRMPDAFHFDGNDERARNPSDFWSANKLGAGGSSSSSRGAAGPVVDQEEAERQDQAERLRRQAEDNMAEASSALFAAALIPTDSAILPPGRR
ncbi:unnamed protein product [Amoebophrya sp. A25]|nr:unnamed protein product [Amoebophrya sp. A25]|eukprot:GSA25T00025608001.1